MFFLFFFKEYPTGHNSIFFILNLVLGEYDLYSIGQTVKITNFIFFIFQWIHLICDYFYPIISINLPSPETSKIN